MKHFSFWMAAALLGTVAFAQAAEVTLIKNGVARCAIYVAPAVMASDNELSRDASFARKEAETQRRRLRDSATDLALYLQKMSGAKIEILTTPPPRHAQDSKLLPILIGSPAQERFPIVPAKTSARQGFRLTISEQGVGLLGESDEATSYAIYEVLDRLGCRWYMPSPMGEVIPHRPTVSLALEEATLAPGTLYRGVWYGDEAFKRRNRLGGMVIRASHVLEGYITKEQREAHPEWRAVIGGKPSPSRLKWSSPGVAEAVADAIIAQLDKNYQPSISLSPNDGASFDETDDRAWDAGDFDPTLNQVSITDRYVRFCNRVVERVTQKHPDVLFGFLAYVQYTRPPIREKPHPNLIPVIAPITYCRAHAMSDEEICPSRPQLRRIIEGWGKVSPRIAYYNYMYHLAEVTVPYPMLHQMQEELPVLYRNNVVFWQPETLPNFESALPGLVLATRQAWNPRANSSAILDEFFARFYGAAEQPMRRYWQLFDDAWVTVPEHAGSGFGHARRFTPQVMQQARQIMDEALAMASTPVEYARIKMQDAALRQFERFIQMRWNLNDGRLLGLDRLSTQWQGTQMGLGAEYSSQFAFSKVVWTPYTVGGLYFNSFFEATYRDGGRIAKTHTLIGKPLREWRYAAEQEQTATNEDWQQRRWDDSDSKTTDIGIETWSDLGLLDFMGTVWYRREMKTPSLPPGKKVFLWFSSTDGRIEVFVNGQAVPFVNDAGETSASFTGFCQPVSLNVTAALRSNSLNQITIKATRTTLNELGTGGLLGPVYLYREK